MPRKPSYATLEADLQRAQAELSLYQLALWRSRQMDVDAVAEVPERNRDGKPVGGWYRYAVYDIDGAAGGILIVTYSHDGQRDDIRPEYFDQWRRFTHRDPLPHEATALYKLESQLQRRDEKRKADVARRVRAQFQRSSRTVSA